MDQLWVTKNMISLISHFCPLAGNISFLLYNETKGRSRQIFLFFRGVKVDIVTKLSPYFFPSTQNKVLYYYCFFVRSVKT